MLGWVLKRGQENAPGASGGPDDTHLEQPDTPAPVFAARAFKTALFGTPAPADDGRVLETTKMAQPTTSSNQSNSGAIEAKSPAKPTGILLTPGTATARRKRVSFGHDVRDNAAKKGGKGGSSDGGSGKHPGPWETAGERDASTRQRTRLTEALEKSRKHGAAAAGAAEQQSRTVANDDEEAWEEVEELDRDPDITVDINEPHSRSGKYWKSEFKRYQEDAKVEMEKLVKYKQLAKSYARAKDTEALDLNEKLREEHDKVAKMEGRITELAGQIARKRMKGSDHDNQEMISSLTRQTALAVQYRNQVKELEAILKDRPQASEDTTGPRRHTASPRTHKTLLEAQRELRRAREQVKELGDAKEEVRRLKSALRSAERRELKVETENKRLAADLSKANSKAHDLEKRLEAVEDEARQKRDELRGLKLEYDTLKQNAKARVGEAEQVLRRKNEEISDLKKRTRLSRVGHVGSSEADLVGLEENSSSRKQGLAGPQAKPKAEQEQRNRAREEERIRPAELANISNRHTTSDQRCTATASGLPTQDSHDPHSIDILEDDDTLPPFITATKQPEPAQNLPNIIRASSTILRDRANREKPPAGRRSSAVLHGPYERRLPGLEFAHRNNDNIRGRVPHGDEILDEVPRAHRNATEHARATSAALNAIRPVSSDSEGPGIDLVQGKFARLGGPGINSSAAWTVNTSRSTLPADRRAAAIARLEQKRMERKRALESRPHNKENVRP